MKWGVLGWLGVALAASGCAPSAPQGPPPVYSLPAGMAGLYAINVSQQTMFPAEKTVSEGGREIARLGPERFVFVPIAPGRHDLRCDDLPMTNAVALSAVSGRLYYLRIEMGATAQVQHCELMTQDTADALLRQYRPEAQNR